MAGYSARQSSFTTGDTITAAHSNNEFNQILAAFHVSTGHTHDGTTAGDGGPLSTLYSNAISMGTGADTDIVLTFNANTSDGVITWMEDEDYFKFSDDILVNSTEKLQFRDTAIYLYSSADGQLDLVADTEIQIAATTVDINGNVDISGSLTLGGTAITSTAAELNIMDGGTSATSTTVADADRVVYNDAGTMKQVAVTDLDTYISATSKTLTNKTLTSPVLNTGVSGTAVADEDDMSSNSATKLATQQSIKAYVDAQITAEDLDVTSDSGTIAIDLDSETLTIAGGTGLDSSATSNTVTLAIDSTVTTLTGSQTLTNKTLTSPVLNTGVSGTAVLDEDNMASDSATQLATQQSIKAYVDSVSTGITTFVMEDDDGTEVTISNNKEIKYIGSGLTTNWTDTDNGTDGDPYDLTFTVDAAQTGITSILATDLKIGEDDETKIDFETANEIHFYANNTEQVYLADNIFGPQSDSDVDLGTTSVRWKDAYVDSVTVTDDVTIGGDLTVNGTTTTVNSTTVTIDDPIFTLGGDSAPGSDDNKDRGIEFRWHNGSAAKVGFFGYDDSESAFTFIPDASNSSEVFSGTVGNVIFGNITGTLQTAAQTNITSVGALDGGSITSGFGTIDTGSSNITTTGLISGGSLDIDDVLINGTTIGHTDDTDLLTLASGALTVAGTIEGTTITASTALVPDASGGANLGSASLEWGDLYIADDKKIYLGSDQNFSIEYDEDGNDTTAVVAANGVSFAPHGSSSGNGTELRFQELAANGANYVGFKAPDAIASNEVWVLPNADGSANQVLKTDGSNALSWVDQAGGGTVSLVADGAITAGKPCVLTGAGKAAQITETTSYASSPTVKSVTTMDNSDTASVSVNTAYESNSGAFVMVYKDTSGSSYGTAVAGTWSDGTMTWGTPVVFESSAIDDQPHICAGGNRVHVTYRASDGKSGIRSASISGTTLSFAAETVWGDAPSAASGGRQEVTGTMDNMTAVYDTGSNRIVTFYSDDGNSLYGTAVVSVINNATTGAITFGTPVVFNSATTVMLPGHGSAYDANADRVVVCYRDEGDSHKGKAIVGQVTAGTNAISFGTEVEFSDGSAINHASIVEDPNTDRVAIFYADSGNSEGRGVVGTVTAGTNAIAFGSASAFESTAVTSDSGVYGRSLASAYEPDTNKILVVYNDGSTNGQARVATVTGGTTNSIAYGTEAEWTSNNVDYPSVAYDTEYNKFVIAYSDKDDSTKGKVISATISGTSITFENITTFASSTNTRFSAVFDPVSRHTVVAHRNGSNSRLDLNFIRTHQTTPNESSLSNADGGTGAPHFVNAIYDPDNKKVIIIYKADTDADLSQLVIHPDTGSSSMGNHCIYDTSTNYVLISSSTGPSQNVYIYPIYHDTSDGTYTVGTHSKVRSGNLVSQRGDFIFDPDTNRGIFGNMDSSNSDRPTAHVIQSGGTAAAPTVTIGAASVVETDGCQIVSMCYDTTNNKVFFAYDNSTDTETKGAIGTVTGGGTNTIAFAGIAQIRDTGTGDSFDVEFDQVGEKIIHLYRDEDDGNDLTYQVITPGASSFSVSSATEISANDNRLQGRSMSFGASKGILAGLYDADNSNKISYTSFYFASTTTSNLDNGNYLGIAAESISDTATGKINIPGGVNENQSSLTIGNHYFTNGNGVVGLVGSTTGEQYLGKAIAADKIQLLENEGYLYGTAEGAVTAGKPIFVEADGDFLMPVSTTTTYTHSIGSETDLSGNVNVVDYFGATYDASAERHVVVYMDGENSTHTYAKTYTVSGTNVVSNTCTQALNSTGYGMEQPNVIYDSNAEKCLIVYKAGQEGNDLRCRVLTIGATTVSVGSEVTIDDDNNTGSDINLCYDTTNSKIIVFTRDQSNSNYPTAYVGSISGTTPSFGSAQVVQSEGAASSIGCAFGNDKFLFVYEDTSTNDGQSIVATISGSTLSFGTKVEFEDDNPATWMPKNNVVCYDSATDKFVLAYSHSGGGDPMIIKACSVSGTTPTWGGETGNADVDGEAYSNVIYGSNNVSVPRVTTTGKVPFVHRDASNYFYYREATLFSSSSNNVVQFSSAVNLETSHTNYLSFMTLDTTNVRGLLGYEASDNDIDGYGFRPNGSVTTTTFPTNGKGFIGIATKDVSDNGQVEVATTGQIDAQQSGLTAGETYYAQSDGTLGTSADSLGSVVAGKALSATKLLIT